MNPPSPPRIGPTRVPLSVYVCSMIGIMVSAVWALWPVPRIAIDIEEQVQAPPQPAKLAALDPEAFAAPIWLAEAPPPDPPPETHSPTPPRLKLVAILWDGSQRTAALYDPDADRLLFAAAGDSFAGLTIDTIDGRAVTFRDGRGTLQLPDWNGGSP